VRRSKGFASRVRKRFKNKEIAKLHDPSMRNHIEELSSFSGRRARGWWDAGGLTGSVALTTEELYAMP